LKAFLSLRKSGLAAGKAATSIGRIELESLALGRVSDVRFGSLADATGALL
jgi:hypothetical protein